MKNVLLVAPFCSLPGEPYFNRFLYLAEFLSSSTRVKLVTSRFRHFDKKQRQVAIKNLPFEVCLIDEPGYRENVSLARIYSHWKFSKNFAVWLDAELADKNYDVVYSAFPLIETNILLGKRKRKHGFRLIIDVQDVWPESISGALPFVGKIPLGALPFSRKANSAYRMADHLIAVSETYLDRARIANKSATGRVIYIGSDAEKMRSIAAEHLDPGKTHFVYLGSLGHSYDLLTVVRGFEKIYQAFPNYEFHILGDGPLKNELQNIAPPSVIFYGFLSYEKMISIAKGAHYLINPIKAAAMQSITNKLSDYILLQKPIISSQKNVEAVKLLEKTPSMYYEAGNVDSFVKVVSGLTQRKDVLISSDILDLFDRKLSYEYVREIIGS